MAEGGLYQEYLDCVQRCNECYWDNTNAQDVINNCVYNNCDSILDDTGDPILQIIGSLLFFGVVGTLAWFALGKTRTLRPA